MLSDPITLKYNNDPNGPDFVFDRINTGNYSSDYVRVNDGRVRNLTVKHTIPKKFGDAESHMIRLDDTVTDTDGNYLRTESVWIVCKTTDGAQSTSALKATLNTLINLAQDAQMEDVLNRES